MYDLNDIDEKGLDKAIADGIKDMPSFKVIADAPSSSTDKKHEPKEGETPTHKPTHMRLGPPQPVEK